MKFSQKDKPLLFSSTSIPDVFFAEYLPEADSNFIKVYLYILYSSTNEIDININDLSKTLSLEYSVVEEAFRYWETKGLLIKTTEGYVLSNIQEIEAAKVYSPKVTSSPEDALKSAENQYRAEAIECINSQFFQGVMSPSWYNDIDLWFNKYGFDEDVMIALFNYAYEKTAESGGLHRNYIEKVAEGWSNSKIKTFNDLDSYFEKQEKRSSISTDIKKKLNIYRNLTTYEEEDIIKWTENFGFSIDVIEIALKQASSKNKVTFKYIDALLADWYSKEFTTVEEVNNYLDSQKNVAKKTKELKQKTLEYTQSSFDNLNLFYDN